jgi:hypothetical protein
MHMLFLLFLLALMPANDTCAESTVACHCFQDREYDPQRADAADPYFLATTQNALLANLFGVSKKDVVRAKMGGADGDRLWIAHYLAQQSGKPFAEIDRSYSEEVSWRQVAQQLKIDPDRLAPRLVAALGDQKRLAMVVVDDQLTAHIDLETLQLQRLRDLGADNQQTVMAVFVGQSSPFDPVVLFNKVAAGQVSWGALLAEQGLFNGSEIDARWQQILIKKH